MSDRGSQVAAILVHRVTPWVEVQSTAGGFYVPALEARQDAGEHALVFDDGTARDVELHPHLAGQDVGQSRLAEPRRTAEQDVVERLFPFARRLHVHA